MEIVGNGLLAGHLRESFGDRYPRVVAAAAGVTKTTGATIADYDREAELVYRLLRRCRTERRLLLFFSTASFAMYGPASGPSNESDPLYPPAAYGRHKLALESCVRASGADHLILRLTHVVGIHRQPNQLLPALVNQVLGGTVTIHHGAARDLLDAEDFCFALDRLLESGVGNTVVNIASGEQQPIELIVERVEQRLGMTARRDYVHGRATRTRPSIERLLGLVPEFRKERIGPDYLERLLDSYLPHLVELGKVPMYAGEASGVA